MAAGVSRDKAATAVSSPRATPSSQQGDARSSASGAAAQAESVESFAARLEPLSPQEVLGELVERFHPRMYVAASFQKETSVLVDMLVRLEPSARFFTLDTDVLFPETYETWKGLEDKYDIRFDVYRGPSIGRQAALHGDRLWERDPDACCGIRKLEPLKRALADVDVWVGGLRRDQSESRASTPKLGWDKKNGLWKASPLAEWTDKDVWGYIFANDIPYNTLHDQGYGSIGCTHCTVPGEGRAGRWAGTGKTECGLHPG